jgi:triosephosphate isomerase
MAPKTPSRKPLMAGNWKMNLNHYEAIKLVQQLAFGLKETDFDAVDVAVLPPFTDRRAHGAYTGEVSGAMLAKLGCSYVLAGHSERRQYHHEDDALVNAKARAAIANGITPIVCVGEGMEVRKGGHHIAHTLAQVDGALEKIPADKVRTLVIAYEPVWAIGTGEVATPADCQEVCQAVRGRVADLYDAEVAGETRILYGGSVKGSNVAKIMAGVDVDGALVGGASLDPGEFVKICRYRDLPA